MTEAEHDIYSALKTISKMLPACVDSVQDNEEVRCAVETLSKQLMRVIGKRTIMESIKNGQASTS